MPNSFFQFKQFRIEQGQAAMKVTTEACIFGSLIDSKGANRVLDIGTGTGLLSLMLAQRSDANMDAIELEEDAYLQASQNFKNSSWPNRLNAIAADARIYKGAQNYDLIISNPPFFSDHQQGREKVKNQALHTNTLGFQDLVDCIDRNLSQDGNAWILLPQYEMSQFIEMAKMKDLRPAKIINVYNRPGKPVLRQIVQFNHSGNKASVKEIHIREKGNDYSQGFVDLLKPYYLHL